MYIQEYNEPQSTGRWRDEGCIEKTDNSGAWNNTIATINTLCKTEAACLEKNISSLLSVRWWFKCDDSRCNHPSVQGLVVLYKCVPHYYFWTLEGGGKRELEDETREGDEGARGVEIRKGWREMDDDEGLPDGEVREGEVWVNGEETIR